jgi:hypothetical protein
MAKHRGTIMIRELDTVVLDTDAPPFGLRRGDVGAVVHVYADGTAFEVEFVAANGHTIALLTLTEAEVRPLSGQEILHVRQLAAA